MDMHKTVIEKIDQMEREIILRTQEYVRYPSVSGAENDAQMYIAARMRDLGMDVDVWDPLVSDAAINPYFICERKDFSGSPNVVGVLKGSGGGRSLIINGHVDVVPAGHNDWNADPFSGKHEDGRIYGRGSSDMKGGFMAGLMAVKALRDLGLSLSGDVIVQSVIGEETGGIGTLSAIKRGYKADAAIVPEPTDMKICPASIGAMWFRITVKGRSAHAATAHFGVSAILKSVKVIEALSALEARRNGTNRHPLYQESPTPFALTVGKIKGGVFPTNVPEETVMEGRMAIMPGEELAVARKLLEDAVRESAANDPWMSEHQPLVEWFGFAFHSNEIPHDHDIVKALQKNFAVVCGKQGTVTGTPWGTDAAATTLFGKTPAVVFGPGPGESAHKANEYLDVGQLMDTCKIIALSIVDWCK